jgi:two-component system CheB/CheR fusion protein
MRWAVDPWLDEFAPFATLYGAVAIAVWLTGYRSAALAALLGYLASDLFFVVPHGRIALLGQENMIALASYAISCALIITVGEAMRRERRNAQVASDQVRIVADTMAVGVTRCSRDMRYVWVNQSYSDWIHVPADRLVGASIADIVGEEAFAALLPYYQRVLDGETIQYEKEVEFKGVARCWISATYTPTRDANGIVDGWVSVVLDISKRKAAESERAQLNEELRNRVEELQKLMEIFPGGILTADATCERITGNPAFYTILGLPRGSNASLPASDSDLPPGTRIFRNGRQLQPEEYPMQAAGITGTTILDFDHDIVFPDGRVVTLLANTTPLLDERGNVRGVLGAVMDITARKHAENELRQSRERIRDDLDALTRLHAVADLCATVAPVDECLRSILDTAIAFTRTDRGNIQLLDRDSETLRIVTHSGFEEPVLRYFETVATGDATACAHAMDEAERVIIDNVAESAILAGHPTRQVLLDAGIGAVQSTPLLTSDGQLIGMISTHSAQPRSFDERMLRWLDVLARQAADYLERRRNFDALRENEERYRSLVNVITDVPWVSDPDGHLIGNQPAWEAYTGQTQEQYSGPGWVNAIHPDDRERVGQLWQQACETRSPYESRGRMWHAATQSWRYYIGRALPLLNADGTVRVWVGAATDVDDLVRATEALREADQRKDEFLAMLAHELRNPLAPIGYAAEILKKDHPSTAQLVKAREVIDRQVRQMGRLLDDLMDVSRITRGTISLRKKSVELAAVLNDAVEASRPLIEEAGHTLRVDLPSTPIMLDADAARISQVLMNLLNNAAKYTEPGGSIQVRVTMEGDGVSIAVKDSGVGIPPEMLARVFELFVQEDRSIDRSRGGLGIGLTLAQRLVDLHNGTLEARSEGVGRGSEFVIRLPVVLEKSVATIGITPEKTNGAQHMRILVVDDNEDSADTMAMYLQANGHDVRTANDGLVAVETAAQFQPEAILMDIGLPKLNGYDAAARIRAQRGPDVLLVALTGWGQEEDRRRSREAGFDHHLTKPVELDALQRLLSAAHTSAPGP